MTTRVPRPASENDILAYPVASAGVAVTAGAANTYGAYAEAIAAATITTAFRVVGVSFNTPSAGLVGTLSVAVGAGGAEDQILEVPFEIASDAGGFFAVPVYSQTCAANARVAVRLKTVAGGETAAMRVMVQAV